MRKSKGITLIALVITIVILIILAGIAISLSIGDNGIFTKAEKSKENYMIAQNMEKQEIEDLYSQILIASDSTVTLTTEQLNEYINKKVEEALGSEQQTTTTDKGKYSFEKKGNIVFCTFYDVAAVVQSIYSGDTTGILLEELPYNLDTSKYEIYNDSYIIGCVFSGSGTSTAFLRVLNDGKLQVCYQASNVSQSNRPILGSFWYYTTD